jgi:4-amino-4-deoxy-L-arabinose transferase-like glycosyltransferase
VEGETKDAGRRSGVWYRDPVLWAVLLAALGLRLWIAASLAYMWDEDRDWFPLALSISFDPESLNLPIRGLHHPALPAYLTKLGAVFVGTSHVGYRFFHVLCGVVSVAVVYRMGHVWAGRTTARWAAALLAFAEYHVYVSTLAIDKSASLTCSLVALAAFAGFLRDERPRSLYLAGAFTALAFLGNERAALLLPVFFVTFFVTPRRRWLLRKEPYVALGVFVALISPDLLWHLGGGGEGQTTYSGHLSRFGGIGFSRHYLLFYLRQPVKLLYEAVGKTLNDPAIGYPAVNGVFGILMLGAVGLATLRARSADAVGRLLLVLFWFVMLFYVLVRTPDLTAPDLDQAVWFWVEPTLFAAVLVTARVLDLAAGRPGAAARVAAAAACVIATWAAFGPRYGLAARQFVLQPETLWPPDGRMVDVRANFDLCDVADQEPRYELVRVWMRPGGYFDWMDVPPADVEFPAADGDPRDFRLRAQTIQTPEGERTRVYRVRYKLTEASGEEIFLEDGLDVPYPDEVRRVPPFWVD